MALNAAELAILVKVYDEASGTLDKIEGKSKGLIGTLMALAPAVAGAFVGFASVEVFDKAIDKAKELGEQVRDLAMKTGLSDEAASHLIHAAEVTGVGYETMSKGLGIFAKNLTAAQEEAVTSGGKLSDAQQKTADTIRDAQERMSDATQDAQRKISDATEDASRTISRAFRDRNDAVKDANHEFINSMRDATRAVMDARHDVEGVIRQSNRDLVQASRDVAKAETELLRAREDAAKHHGAITAAENDRIISAQDRVRDAHERVTQLQEDIADRMSKANERVTVSTERVTEVQYRETEKLKDINQKYADTVQDANQRVNRTVTETNASLARTYREVQETIAHAGVKITEATDKSEVDTKKFGLALTDLGINMNDVVDKSGRLTEEGFDLIADHVAKMPASMTRTADVMAIFGKNGAALEPLFALGAKGLRETAAEADRLGLTLSAENVEKIHEYAESHRRMNEAIKGVQVQIGLYLMPLLTKFAEWFIENQPAIRAFIDKALVKLNEVLEALLPPLSEVADGWLKIGKFLAEHQTALAITIGLIIALVVAFNPWIVLVPALIILIGVLADNWDSLGSSIAGVARLVRDVVIGAFNAVIGFFRDHWVTIVALAGGPLVAIGVLFATHLDEIKHLAQTVLDFITGIPGQIIGLIGSVGDAAYHFGMDIVNSIVDGIESAPGAIIDAITSLLPGGIDLGSIIPDLPHFPGHAAGVRYVAHDELAILHRGETVRTASETRNDGGGVGGIGGIHFYGDVTLAGDDLDRAASDVGYAMATELRGRGFAI